MAKKQKQEWITFYEDGKRFMLCKDVNRSMYQRAKMLLQLLVQIAQQENV